MSKPLTAPKERLHLTEHYVVENDSYRKHFCRCVWKNRIVFPASLNEVHDFPWGGGAGGDFFAAASIQFLLHSSIVQLCVLLQEKTFMLCRCVNKLLY